MLAVSASREQSSATDTERFHRFERRYGTSRGPSACRKALLRIPLPLSTRMVSFGSLCRSRSRRGRSGSRSRATVSSPRSRAPRRSKAAFASALANVGRIRRRRPNSMRGSTMTQNSLERPPEHRVQRRRREQSSSNCSVNTTWRRETRPTHFLQSWSTSTNWSSSTPARRATSTRRSSPRWYGHTAARRNVAARCASSSVQQRSCGSCSKSATSRTTWRSCPAVSKRYGAERVSYGHCGNTARQKSRWMPCPS